MSDFIQHLQKPSSRLYITGDEWIYYKVYCGPKTADKILLHLNEVLKVFHKDHLIDSWFFIRYGDPDHHLRLRFQYSNKEAIVKIVEDLNIMLHEYLSNNLVWKVINDTYQPEIERYGTLSMRAAEDIFHHDSQMILDLLEMLEGDEGEKIRWLFSLRAMDEFLSSFKLNTEQKYDLMRRISASFAKEHNKDETLAKQLSKIFRENKKEIQDILNPHKDHEREWTPAIKLIHHKNHKIQRSIDFILNLYHENQLERPIDEYLSSYLHMLNNRLFRSKNRLHEMVVYDFLFRYYKSSLAREKYAKK